jgi:hypothetical protein
MNINNFIGGRGEAIAFACLTRICRPDVDLPYFWPHFLGEKAETFDFLVELVDAGEITPIFFVQVEATRKAYTKTQVPARLPVQVSEKDMRRMLAYPAPTYVVAVHEDEERAFIISVHGTASDAIASITTAHEMTCETLRRLWDEVRNFWLSREVTRLSSSFSN